MSILADGSRFRQQCNARSTAVRHDQVPQPPDPIDGGDAIRAYFEQSFAKRPPHLRDVRGMKRIEMLAPDEAFVDTEVRLERRADDGSWPTICRFKNYTVAIRDRDAWRIKEVRTYVRPDTAVSDGTSAASSIAGRRQLVAEPLHQLAVAGRLGNLSQRHYAIPISA